MVTKRVSELARDIGEILLREDLGKLKVDTAVGKIAVQTPCSLQHGLKQPDLIAALLARVGFQLVAAPDSHLCCGSAGTYSILEADMSLRLRDRKLRALQENSPDLIATGNIGCMTQIGGGTALPVVHTVQLLDWAYGGPKPAGMPEPVVAVSGSTEPAVAAG